MRGGVVEKDNSLSKNVRLKLTYTNFDNEETYVILFQDEV